MMAGHQPLEEEGLGLEEGLLLGIKVQLLLKTNFVSRCGHQQAGGRRASRPRLLYDWDFINGMRNIYVRNIDQLVGLMTGHTFL